jgi:hypothetical protein
MTAYRCVRMSRDTKWESGSHWRSGLTILSRLCVLINQRVSNMGYAICPCGNRISDTAMPAPHLAYLVPSIKVDQMMDYRTFDAPLVYQCEKCERLGVSDGPRIRWYKPDV